VWVVLAALVTGGAVYLHARTSPSPPIHTEVAIEPATLPAFSSGDADYDGAYVKAMNVIASDVVGGRFIAGQSWDSLWTRDSAYSVDLGAALVQPGASKQTLYAMTQDDAKLGKVWAQDVCGHFGGWPNLTDAIVGAVGAWTISLLDEDRDFLEFGYTTTLRTLERAERDAYIAPAGLFGGCSSFMESNSAYPARYARRGDRLAKTKALSTNLLYYRGYVLAAQMGQRLGKEVSALEGKAERLKKAINDRLWMPALGYYAYFEDEEGKPEARMEGLGEALAILWKVADDAQADRILESTPTTPWGIPSQWPQYPEYRDYDAGDSHYYHNGMIWPFVQGYWAVAAASRRSLAKFDVELEHMVALSRKSDTFYEFYRPEDGTPDGSRRQLWSAAGYLAAVVQGLFGVRFEAEGLAFEPLVPSRFTALQLTGMRYRTMTLDLTVHGSGTRLATIEVDGRTQESPRVALLAGTHRIDLHMAP
jgi:hypothetical protein